MDRRGWLRGSSRGPRAALRKPHGRSIGSWKRKAREALPHGTLQEQADYANQLAHQDGYLLHITGAQMQSKALPPAQQPTPPPAAAEPTVAQLLAMVELTKKHGGVADLLAKVRAVDDLARQVGGLASLRARLELLAKLQGVE
jgi:hypothetical protein